MSTRCVKQNLQVITAAPPPNPMDAIVEGFDMVKKQKELQNCDKNRKVDRQEVKYMERQKQQEMQNKNNDKTFEKMKSPRVTK